MITKAHWMIHWMKKSLPDWMRARLSDAQRFLVLCVLAGFLCGLTAVAFHYSIHHLFDWLWEFASGQDPVWFCVVLVGAPTLAGLLVGLSIFDWGGASHRRGIGTAARGKGHSGGWRGLAPALVWGALAGVGVCGFWYVR